MFSSAAVPLRCRLCCHIGEREREIKASDFWTCLERERDRRQRGRESGER